MVGFSLSDFHQRNREKIILEWVNRLQTEVGDQYALRPREELIGTVSEALEANDRVINHGDYGPIDRFIEKITRMRLGAGFLLSDVQKAFECYRDIVIPMLARESFMMEEYCDLVVRINKCLAHTIHRFSDFFQEMHEKKILEHNRRLEEEVRARTAQLRESELRYKTLVEEINDGYFVIQDEVIVFANKAYCRMHGYSLEEVLGRKYHEFVDPRDVEKVVSIYRKSFHEGSAPSVFEYLRRNKDGKSFPTEITAKLTHYEGKISNLGLCRDISRRVEMEMRMREAEKMAYIGEITTSLSHEIRNPLSAVKMNLQIIKRNAKLKGNDQRRIDISAREVMRLERTLTELLDFAKPLELHLVPCKVNDVLNSCVELLETKFGENGLIPIVRHDPDLPEISCDGEKLGQALINLLLNAIEASPEGGRIFITTRYRPDRKPQGVELFIEDEGPGISSSCLPEIFKPFFTTKSRGTGLGLSNVKRIMESHGGEVTVVNRNPHGASFRVFLPEGSGYGKSTSC